MYQIKQFESLFINELPQTHELLQAGGLVLHAAVARVTLHGSRGVQGGARSDSDIDLSLEVSRQALESAPDAEKLLHEVLATTLDRWAGEVELDLAAVFDKIGCGLQCLQRREFDCQLCPSTIDCIGLFKMQKGFNGYVSGPYLDISKMYPLCVIWQRPGY